MTSKHFIVSLLASALFAGLGASPAMAQHGTIAPPGMEHLQQSISMRIQQGLASGRITPSEAQVLYRRDREISVRTDQYKASIHPSPQAYYQLRAEQDALNAEVERMMGNRDAVRPPAQAGAMPGLSDSREFQISQRQISQRIDQGLRSDRISHREARRLHDWERDIGRHETRLKSDGVVTLQERQQLRSELLALRDEVERMMREGERGRGHSAWSHR